MSFQLETKSLVRSDYKSRVTHCFNRAAETYDKYCYFQDSVAARLMAFLESQAGQYEYVLDLGCGTGNSTQLLARLPDVKKIIGLDLAEGLIEKAKLKSYVVQPEWIVSDFDATAPIAQRYDLLFSSMAMQWSEDFFSLLLQLKQRLKMGGTLAFALPITGTFEELKTERKLTLLTDEQLKKAIVSFDKSHFYIEKTTLHFDSAKQALNMIKKIGANATDKIDFSHLGRVSAESFFDVFPPQLTYRIAYVILKNNEEII